MRRAALLLGLATILALMVPALASAVPPEHVLIPIDETFTDDESCAFSFVVHVEAKLRETHFFDGEGRETRVLATGDFKVTFTNPETGKSITTAAPAVFDVRFNEDGSITLAISGLQGHLIVGGQPPLASDVGHLVLFFTSPEDEEPDVIFQGGKFNFGPFPQLCDALAVP